jgi:predicted O-methyltransferase YrrM
MAVVGSLPHDESPDRESSSPGAPRVTVGWRERAANGARNALRPGYARVMAGKALGRIRGDARKMEAAVVWARPRSVPIGQYCRAIDDDLWVESKEFGRTIRAHADDLGVELGVSIGGGARVELLYFLTRHFRPQTIVETGVLHGYSSSAFLHALDRNGDGGRLWSSDFPYFRERDPERLVGVLVPESLRSNWTLLLEGDRKNLPNLLRDVDRVDLFHYDSDKTYAGRRHAMSVIEPRLAADAVVAMDDIQDNLFFADWVREGGRASAVLGEGSYFVGATGVPPTPERTRAER